MTAIAVWAVMTDRISYVVTSGVSMNPVYYQGDLVFVTKADTYHVGEIAAYHGSGTGIEVLHRIIGGDATHGYVFKGDNNESTDIDTPTADQLIGHAVLHVPKGGVWLKPVLSPTALGMMGFLIVGGGIALPRNRREVPRGRRKKKVKAMLRDGGPGAMAAAAVKSAMRLPPMLRIAAVLTLLVMLTGIALGVFGWMKPILESRPATAAAQSLVFSYSTTVPRSAAYDGTVVTSPDPIFRRLAHKVDVRMRYQGHAGTFSATMTLRNGSGWHTTTALIAPARFTGSRYESVASLDLDAIDKRARDAARAIGIQPTPIVIALAARVDRAGVMFPARLELSLTPVQLSLVDGEGSLAVKDAGSSPSLVVRKIGFLTAAAARSWAIFLLILGAAGAIVLFLAARRSVSARTRTEIERLYPQLLVHVEPMASPPGKPVVNVDSFQALARLAERYGQMVLTWRRPDADDFVVRDEGITYRYRVPLDEPILQNVELINRPSGAGTHRRKASSEVS